MAPRPDLIVLHSPWFVAREALAGRASLRESGVRVVASRQPVALVEQFGEEPSGRAIIAIAERDSHPENAGAHLVALELAEQNKDDAGAARAALNLARLQPWNPQALMVASDALREVGESRTAAPLPV